MEQNQLLQEYGKETSHTQGGMSSTHYPSVINARTISRFVSETDGLLLTKVVKRYEKMQQCGVTNQQSQQSGLLLFVLGHVVEMKQAVVEKQSGGERGDPLLF